MLKVTIKGFVANKLRFLLTAVAVALGVAFMSGTMVLTDTVQRTFDDLFADINEGLDAVVRGEATVEMFGDTQRPSVPAELLDVVRDVPGVESAFGNVETYAQIVGNDGKAVGNPGQGAPTFGFAWIDVEELNPMVVREGRPPTADDEIVIDRGSARRGDISVGDRVTVLTSVEPGEYEVVGIATFGTADSPAGATVTMFTLDEAQRVAGFDDAFSDISIVATAAVTEDEVRDRVSAAIAPGSRDLEVLTGTELTAEQQDEIARNLGFFNTALMVFAIVALFVGCFIIYNSFSIIVAQRTREMALLRAIGASGRQVTLSILGESVILAVLASAAGLAGGIALSTGLKAIFGVAGIDIPAGGTVVTTTTIVVAFVVGLVVTVLSAVLPARRASRVPPIAALRDVAIERPHRTLRRGVIGGVIGVLGLGLVLGGLFTDVDNGILYVGLGAGTIFVAVFVLGPLFARPVSNVLGWPLPRIKGMTGTLARENAMRNPARTSRTAAALTIGVALVGFITIFGASVRASVSSALDDQITSDLFVTTGAGFGPGLSPALAQSIAPLPEVETITPIRFGGAKIDGDDEFVTAADPVAADRLFDFGVIAGDLAALGADDIAVSERTMESKGWQLGDTIPVTFAETGATVLRIGVVYERYEIPDDYLLSLQGFEAHYRTQLDFQVFVDLADGVSIDEGRRAIEPIVAAYPTAELQDQQEYKDTYLGQINQIVLMIYLLLAIAVVIALFGIANTLALSIYERTRELGLLRAVGMTRAQVRSAVRWESVIIALLGTGLGMALGLFFGWVMVLSLRDEGFSDFAIAPGQLAVVVVLGALAGVGAALAPARRAAKLDVLRAIATE